MFVEDDGIEGADGNDVYGWKFEVIGKVWGRSVLFVGWRLGQ